MVGVGYSLQNLVRSRFFTFNLKQLALRNERSLPKKRVLVSYCFYLGIATFMRLPHQETSKGLDACVVSRDLNPLPMGQGSVRPYLRFLPSTKIIFRQTIPWLFPAFCCRCPNKKNANNLVLHHLRALSDTQKKITIIKKSSYNPQMTFSHH